MQALGVVSVGVFVVITSLLMWKIVDLVLVLRVSEDEEMMGLDLAEMGMEAYPSPSARDTR